MRIRKQALLLIVPALTWLLVWASTGILPQAFAQQGRSVPAYRPAVRIASGAGSFTFVDRQGDPSKQMTVYTYLPAGVKPDAARIVFVMHGHDKNAEGWRDSWVGWADKYGFMVVSPLFDPEQWGVSGYACGGVIRKDGRFTDPSMWSFSVIEHLFDAIKDATGNRSARYYIYGHSEGGQFVHRLVLFLPEARYARAIAANSGWYTMPSFDVRFPYGLGGSPVTERSLKKSLGRELVLMLGDQDTDPNHKELNKQPQAMAQGTHRFERGQKFFSTSRQRAAGLNSALGWRLQVVRGAGHSNSKISTEAVPALMAP